MYSISQFIATIILWLVFAWAAMMLIGESVFLPALSVFTLGLVLVLAVLIATIIVMRAEDRIR